MDEELNVVYQASLASIFIGMPKAWGLCASGAFIKLRRQFVLTNFPEILSNNNRPLPLRKFKLDSRSTECDLMAAGHIEKKSARVRGGFI